MTLLPRVLVLTDRSQCPRPIGDQVELLSGLPIALVVREKDLDLVDRLAIADRFDGTVIMSQTREGRLARPGPSVTRSGGVMRGKLEGGRSPLSNFVGRSCHDAFELAGAVDRADYATLSPVFATVSKPGYGPALGIAGLSELIAGVDIPVFGLGGIDAGNAASVREAGAYGVAVMGAVMRAHDPAAVVGRIVEAVR